MAELRAMLDELEAETGRKYELRRLSVLVMTRLKM